MKLVWEQRADQLWNATCACGGTLAGFEEATRDAAESWHFNEADQQRARGELKWACGVPPDWRDLRASLEHANSLIAAAYQQVKVGDYHLTHGWMFTAHEYLRPYAEALLLPLGDVPKPTEGTGPIIAWTTGEAGGPFYDHTFLWSEREEAAANAQANNTQLLKLYLRVERWRDEAP